jgi:hypothetical protein
MSQQTINLLITVLLLVHGEVGGSGLFEQSPGGHLLLGPSDLPDPFLPGPYDVDHHHIAREIFGQLDHNLDIYAPHSAGTFPVIIFFPGMACTTPASAYSNILTHLASWGYVVVGPSALLYSTDATYRAEWVQPVVDWTVEHINSGSLSASLHPEMKVDATQLYLSAHSSGSHVAVEFIKQSRDCYYVKAMLLLSPVDGVDPFGLIDTFCINPPQPLHFRTPTLIIAGGLDGVPGIDVLGGLMPACAPEELGSSRFYGALEGPTLLLNMTSYGHVDMMDQTYIDIIQAISFCKTDSSTDKDAFRQEVGGQLVSFLSYVSQGACQLWHYMEGSQDSGTGVHADHKWKGGVEYSCGECGCKKSTNVLQHRHHLLS